MTNLEKAGSLRQALETYPKPNELLNFKKWCKAPCEQILPEWLEAGKWFEIVETDEYYKITEITGGLVHTTCGDAFHLNVMTSSNLTYSPITIKPWSLLEAEAVMRARTYILLDGKTIKLAEVITRYEGSEDNLIIVKSNVDGPRYSTGYLAEYGETDDHQPCGTIIPLYQKEN